MQKLLVNLLTLAGLAQSRGAVKGSAAESELYARPDERVWYTKKNDVSVVDFEASKLDFVEFSQSMQQLNT